MTFTYFLQANNGVKNIHLNIRFNQVCYTFCTPLRLSASDWDDEKQRPKNIYKKTHKKINNKLNEIKIKLSEYIVKYHEKKREISQRKLLKELQNVCKEKENYYSEGSLLEMTQQYLQNRKNFVCHSTYKRYKVFFSLIHRFEGFLGKRVLIEEVSMQFVEEFMLFCKAEEYSENTTYRSICFIKTILGFAEKKGLKTAIKQLEFRNEKQQKRWVTLSEQELLKIEETVVPKDLEPAKDWLLISCYTGQRISDFMRFSISQVKKINGKICIQFTQQKTNKEILLPLHPVALKVISKNENNFPPLIHPKQYNEHIKRIAQISQLNESIKTKKRIGHRAKNIETQKWGAITSHIGRRSFATNFYGKIPTPLLMEATGHSTEQMFLRYINHTNNERVTILGNYFEEIYLKLKVS